jgi:hypothetical protein
MIRTLWSKIKSRFSPGVPSADEFESGFLSDTDKQDVFMVFSAELNCWTECRMPYSLSRRELEESKILEFKAQYESREFTDPETIVELSRLMVPAKGPYKEFIHWFYYAQSQKHFDRAYGDGAPSHTDMRLQAVKLKNLAEAKYQDRIRIAREAQGLHRVKD